MADEERAVLLVVLAQLFSRGDAASLVASLPPSVQDLSAAVTGDPRWAAASSLAERALVVAAVLDADTALSGRLNADADAGQLGLGAGDDAETDAAIERVSEQLGATAAPDAPPRWQPATAAPVPPPSRPPVVSPAAPRPDPAVPIDLPLPPSLAPLTADSLDLPLPTVDESAESAAEGDAGSFEDASGGGADEAAADAPEASDAPSASDTPPASDAPSASDSPPASDAPPASATPPASDSPPASATPPAPATPPTSDIPSASDAPATGAPPAASLPAADVTTWLNAEVQGGPASLKTGQPSTLAVFFDDAPTASVPAAETVLHFLPQVASIDLDIQLASNDLTVPGHPQTLTVARTGVSAGRALFEITPVHDGPSALSVVVTVAGNFLQRLDLTFDVGGGTAAAAEAYGRPLGAATELQPREAVLEFTPMAGGYRLRAPQVHPDRFVDVLITPDELAARIDGVRTTLLKWVKKGSVSLQLDLAPADRDGLLRDLAQAGIRLYQSIFKGPDASDELKEVGAWLQQSLSGEVTTLQVVSTGFPVPWPLMYLADRLDPAALTWDDFIGMRHVVEQVRMVKQDEAPPPAQIASTPQLGVRVLYNDSIDDTMPSKPVAGQRAYWEKRGVALTEGTTVDDLVKGALAPSASDQLLYLYCHAESSGSDPDASQLILTGNAAVTLGDLWALSPSDDRLAGRPLVFLNACESGEMSPNFYDGFVAYFTAKGARGVIGTECKTPGLFAGEWAKAFFDELFAGKTLGETVLDLRRSFLADHGNPLGLLYGVHADPDTVVTPALAAAAP